MGLNAYYSVPWFFILYCAFLLVKSPLFVTYLQNCSGDSRKGRSRICCRKDCPVQAVRAECKQANLQYWQAHRHGGGGTDGRLATTRRNRSRRSCELPIRIRQQCSSEGSNLTVPLFLTMSYFFSIYWCDLLVSAIDGPSRNVCARPHSLQLRPSVRLQRHVWLLRYWWSQFVHGWPFRNIPCTIDCIDRHGAVDCWSCFCSRSFRLQGYHGCAIGKARQNAKTEIEKIKMKDMSIKDLVKEAARM